MGTERIKFIKSLLPYIGVMLRVTVTI